MAVIGLQTESLKFIERALQFTYRYATFLVRNLRLCDEVQKWDELVSSVTCFKVKLLQST
jgi:hypothetical protein